MTQPTDSNQRPLQDKSILLTRPAGQSDGVGQTLERLGAKVTAHPVIQILPPDNFDELDDCLKRLSQFDWLVFVSPNAVRFFCERFGSQSPSHTGSGDSFSELRKLKVAAIGSSTLEAWQTESGEPNCTADLIPAISNSESLGHELAKQAKGQRVLIPRVDRHSETLTDILTQSGVEFEQPPTCLLYTSPSPRDATLSRMPSSA